MEEERIGLFIDYENLAIGAREDLAISFDFKPIADALAERGRVVVRRAYADWSMFEADRRMLTENHVELIEIPQRKGLVRKNAADIKMAVDAVELAFERDYITTFVICTGDSRLHAAGAQAARTEQAGHRRRAEGTRPRRCFRRRATSSSSTRTSTVSNSPPSERAGPRFPAGRKNRRISMSCLPSSPRRWPVCSGRAATRSDPRR